MNLKCPNCEHEFALDNLIESQIVRKHKDLLIKEMCSRENSLKKEKQEFDEKRAQARANYKEELKVKTKQIESEVMVKLNEEFKVKMDLNQQQLEGLNDTVKNAAKIELALRQENNTLLQKQGTFDLEVARKVGQELEKTRRQAVETSEQQHKIELLEKEQSILELKKALETLNRKLSQGSQQMQGEVGELLVEDVLRQEFPEDELHPVPRGQNGADIIQHVIDKRGRRSGKLIIEIKRTKSWSNNWIDKIKNDQREEHADIAVIISEALPDMARKRFANIDGVWVCDFIVYRELISTLRYQLINIYCLSTARQNEETKATLVYDYVTGTEFKQTVDGIMDSLKQARENLDHEKLVMQKSWARREKLLDRISCSSIKIKGNFEVLTGNIVKDEQDILECDRDDVA